MEQCVFACGVVCLSGAVVLNDRFAASTPFIGEQNTFSCGQWYEKNSQFFLILLYLLVFVIFLLDVSDFADDD